MNELRAEIQEFEDTLRYSVAAKRIKEKLDPLKSHIEIAKRRWFWELLQNASDYNDNVDIEVELGADFLEFRHNGKPFTYVQARNLIEPDSDKDEVLSNLDNQPIGQFGSGFLATHILSTYISVSGIIETKDKLSHFEFKYDLDRKSSEKHDLMESIRVSLEQLNSDHPKINYIQNRGFGTKFRYDFRQPYNSLNCKEIAENGISYCIKILPFVLSLLPKVRSVKFIYHDKPPITYVGYEQKLDHNDYKIFQVDKTIENFQPENQLVLKIEEGNTILLLDILKNDNGQIIINPYEKGTTPILFKYYPLIGTETFNFPVVIHNKSFKPTTERDGIELSENDIDNRNSLIEATKAYQKLLIIAEREEWKNQYHLCQIQDSTYSDQTIKNWFKKNIIDEIRKSFYVRKVVETIDKPISFKDSIIPYSPDKKYEDVSSVYNFASKLKLDFLPKEDHFYTWCNQLDFTYFKEQKYDLERLVKDISIFKNIINLKNKLPPDTNLKTWLNDIIKFIIDSDNKHYLVKYPIIPNQNEVFTSPSRLEYDDNIPEILKEILKGISKDYDWKDILIHKDFEEHIHLYGDLKTKDSRNICREIDEQLQKYTNKRQDSNFLKGVNSILDWIKENEFNEEIVKDYFPWFDNNKAQIYLETFSNPKIRENIFTIAQSDKIDSLAIIAKSSLTNSDVELIAGKIDAFKSFLSKITDVVDDVKYADGIIGNEGEILVYSILCEKFNKELVEWSSKELGEGRFDFRILNNNGSTRYFIDVKTTERGIANENSVPFFMRKSQWEFLSMPECIGKYLIARVYLNGNELKVHFLNINKITLI